VNKAQLIDAVAARLEVSRRAAGEAVDAVLDGITGAVVSGDKVSLTGFGTFESANRPARIARNPRTGEQVRVAAATVPKFRAGQAFKDSVNGAKGAGRKTAAKRTTAKKAGTKAAPARAAAKKTPAKAAAKTPAKKSTAKKAVAKTTAKAAAAKKAVKKSARPISKKTAAKAPATKSAVKKTAAASAAAKKTIAKKAAAKKR
jgi:DNA-binding protein HU-beta